MTPGDFCLWLSGFLDALPTGLDEGDIEKVRERMLHVEMPQREAPFNPDAPMTTP